MDEPPSVRMIVFDTTPLKNQNAKTLIFKNKILKIQEIKDEESATLSEIIIPYLYSTHDDEDEIFIEIDENLEMLINNQHTNIATISDGEIDFGWSSYHYKDGEAADWGTRLPNFCCITQIPDLKLDSESLVEIKVKNNKCSMKVDETITYCFPVHHQVRDFTSGIKVKGKFIPGDVICNLYLEDNFPVCIETIDKYTERLYIAPHD